MKKSLLSFLLALACIAPAKAEPVFVGHTPVTAVEIRPSSVTATGTITAPAFVGDGTGLTNVTGTDNARVLKTGDTMTGQLTIAGSTLTVQGSAFSVGGSTLTVAGGFIGLRSTAPQHAFEMHTKATDPTPATLTKGSIVNSAFNSLTPTFTGLRATGNFPGTAAGNNAAVAAFGGAGFDGSVYGSTWGASGSMVIWTDGVQSVTNHGTNISFAVTPRDSIVANFRPFQIDQGGGVSILPVSTTPTPGTAIFDHGFARPDAMLVVKSSGTSSDKAVMRLKDNNLAPLLTVMSDLKVGVGVAAPAYPLHVVGDSYNTGQKIIGSSVTIGADLALVGLNPQFVCCTGGGRLKIGLSGSDITLNETGGGNIGIGTATPGNKLSVTGSADISGNVGIGITNPTNKVEIHDTQTIMTIKGTATDGYGIVQTQNNNGSNARGELYTLGSAYVGNIFGTAGANRSAVVSNGSSSDGLAIGTLTSDPLVLGTNDTERVRILSGGNVGIGTTNPAAKLDVAGSIAINGIVALSSAPVMHFGGFNSTLGASTTFFATTPDSAITLRRITATIVVSGIAGSGDIWYCSDGTNALSVTSGAGATAGTVVTATGAASIAAGTRVNGRLESDAATTPTANVLCEYVMQ